MKVEIVMPKMGESLQEGTITKWLKKPGDKIERDEMILEISTDKVDTEVPSPSEGILTRILFGENETVDVGTVIAEIETEAGAAVVDAQPPKAAQPKPEPPKPAPVKETPAPAKPAETKTAPVSSGNLTDIVMPKMGESLQEGTITRWLKKVGDKIERDEMILEISTDKVDTEVPSSVEGVLTEILYPENTTVEVGTVIARVSAEGGGVIKAEKTPEPVLPKAEAKPAVKNAQPEINVPVEGGTKDIPRKSGERFYSPLVRSIAETEGVTLEELDRLTGSGLDGRVSKKDILDYLEKRKTSVKPTANAAMPSAPAIIRPEAASISIGEDDEIIPMDHIRQIIAEHMVYSKQTSAHVTSVGEADVTNIVKYRKKNSEDFLRREGFKLTYTPFIAKAIIDAVKAYPMVNVSVEGKNIIRHKRINLGIATALENYNLIVPVIKNSDALSLSGVARAIYDLSTRARSKKLNPDDIKGGTISLTNVGTFGTLFGSPIINQPNTAIIGFGAIQKRPVAREYNGEYFVVVRDMVYLSITYDHRVIDGMLAGECLAQIIKNVEAMNEENLVL